VTVGTVFESSHIPLTKWLQALYLITASKKGISGHQLHRMLGITYKSAWLMAHRLRYAMSVGPLADRLVGLVEVDETYVGGKRKNRTGRPRRWRQGEDSGYRSGRAQRPCASVPDGARHVEEHPRGAGEEHAPVRHD
jgi:hypothetical protein